jgi:hypothetical protein
MAPDRRNRIALGVLAVVLAALAYRAYAPATETGVTTSNPRGSTAAATGTVTSLQTPDVRLAALSQERIKPSAGERNLFQFKGKAEAPSTGAKPASTGAAPPTVPGPPAAPAVPPITLKFIGVVVTTEKSQTFAVLRDDRGVYHGREGDIIEGRYRILKIGAESIELAYVDGQGRQTIRLGS